MADNRVVVKINLDANKLKESSDPKMITVWHLDRILAAVLILIGLPVLLLWLFASGDPEQFEQTVDTANLLVTPQPAIESSPKTFVQAETGHLEKSLILKKVGAVIYDKRVIRASLNMAVNDIEPSDILTGELNLNKTRSQDLFYFSEIKSSLSDVLFHRWLKDGRLIFEKQVDKKKNRLISKRLLSNKDIGEWQVLLVDKKGKIYSQASFSVVYR